MARRKHCFDSGRKPGFRQEGREHIYEASGAQGKVWVDLETDAYIIEIDGVRLEHDSTTIHSAKQRCRTAVNSKASK